MIESIRAESRRYKALAEAALAQLRDEELLTASGTADNSVAAIISHLGGNLASRFSDFLTADGEKPWRDREAEFFAPATTRGELLARWERGWQAFFTAVDPLTDADLTLQITIRNQPLTVHDALHRSLAHTAYHVGQVVYVAKSIRGADWKYLSIAPGGSASYNTAPSRERPADAIASLKRD